MLLLLESKVVATLVYVAIIIITDMFVQLKLSLSVVMITENPRSFLLVQRAGIYQRFCKVRCHKG